MVWYRDQIGNDEKGAETWARFQTWLNTPPGSRLAFPSDVPRGPSKAEQIKAAAMAAVGDSGAAFARFAGSS